MPQYQVRLAADQPLEQVCEELLQAMARALKRRKGFEDLGPEDLARMRAELRGAFDSYVKSYPYCGVQAICEENLSPAAWNTKPDPQLSLRRPWESEEIKRLQLVVKKDLKEFRDALLAAALRGAARTTARAGRAKDVKEALETAVADALGPHLYQNSACGECELCKDSTATNPWRA